VEVTQEIPARKGERRSGGPEAKLGSGGLGFQGAGKREGDSGVSLTARQRIRKSRRRTRSLGETSTQGERNLGKNPPCQKSPSLPFWADEIKNN